MLIIDDFFYEIIYVQLGSAIDDSLYFIQEIIEIKSLCLSKVIECYLSVDTLNDTNLQHGFLCHGTNTQLFGTLDSVFLTIFLDKATELLTIALCLAGTYTLDVLQLLQINRIHGCHLFQGDILEHDIRRKFVLLRHIRTQVLEHGKQLWIESLTACAVTLQSIIILEHLVFHYHE